MTIRSSGYPDGSKSRNGFVDPMLSLALIFFSHIPVENYLRCEDFNWLREGLEETTLFTPFEKADILIHWMEHTEPSCFDIKDAND